MTNDAGLVNTIKVISCPHIFHVVPNMVPAIIQLFEKYIIGITSTPYMPDDSVCYFSDTVDETGKSYRRFSISFRKPNDSNTVRAIYGMWRRMVIEEIHPSSAAVNFSFSISAQGKDTIGWICSIIPDVDRDPKIHDDTAALSFVGMVGLNSVMDDAAKEIPHRWRTLLSPVDDDIPW